MFINSICDRETTDPEKWVLNVVRLWLLIVKLIAPFSMERTDLDEVKLIACSIIFNAPAYDLDDQELKEMDENRDIN